MVKVGLVNSDPVYAYMSQAKLDMSAVSLQSATPRQRDLLSKPQCQLQKHFYPINMKAHDEQDFVRRPTLMGKNPNRDHKAPAERVMAFQPWHARIKYG